MRDNRRDLGRGDRPDLLEGLRRVEYRGYDSAGIATVSDGKLEVRKEVGRIDDLESGYHASEMSGAHGHVAHAVGDPRRRDPGQRPSARRPATRLVAVVHNGIIENYLELRERLIKGGHVFKSETDTEVIPHLIEEACRAGKDPLAAPP